MRHASLWGGDKHPWLDAGLTTPTHFVGVEAKRFEPFDEERERRGFSEAYDRPVWGDAMGPFEAMRDSLRRDPTLFRHLNAVQLVKHAFGLVTEGKRLNKRPALVYLFAEPAHLYGNTIPDEAKQRHRAEIAAFAGAVAGAEVAFHSLSYREWLESWLEGPVADHAAAVHSAFQPWA